jgi:glycosyltransferase involved in cell wall biosynthesis
VDVVLEAAGQLTSTPDVCFQILGNGQEYPRMRRLAEECRLTNVSFLPPVPISALPEAIAQADICLGGHFHTNPKADRVIPGKIYQILAIERPLIAADTSANRALLTHGENALLCPPDDSQSLAESIQILSKDAGLRRRLASNGRQTYENKSSEAVITNQLSRIIDKDFPVR